MRWSQNDERHVQSISREKNLTYRASYPYPCFASVRFLKEAHEF